MRSLRPAVTIRIHRHEIEVQEADGVTTRTNSMIMLNSDEKGEVRVASVGEPESEIRQRLEELKRTGKLVADFRLFRAGEDPWWNERCAWPPKPATKSGDRSRDPGALVFNPLASASWYPPGLAAALRYALAFPKRRARGLLSPPLGLRIHLEVADGFTAVERAEILDAVEDIPERAHVLGLPDIARRPMRPMKVVPWVMNAGLLAVVVAKIIYGFGAIVTSCLGFSVMGAALLVQRWQGRQMRYLAPRRNVR